MYVRGENVVLHYKIKGTLFPLKFFKFVIKCNSIDWFLKNPYYLLSVRVPKMFKQKIKN